MSRDISTVVVSQLYEFDVGCSNRHNHYHSNVSSHLHQMLVVFSPFSVFQVSYHEYRMVIVFLHLADSMMC